MGSSAFSGRVALISGAGSGIGLELARAFGRAGAAVVGTDIDAERIGKLVAELKAQGVSAFGHRVDHAKGEEVEALAARVTAEVGPVDILCPNAGVGHMGKIGSIPEKEWRWVLDINLWGIIHMVNVFIPSMIERKRGWVLITASGAGLTPIAGMAPYNVSKAAAVALGATMYMELKRHGIAVSTLCPGFIATNIIQDGVVHGQKNLEAAKGIYGKESKKAVHPSVVARDALRGLAAGVPVIRTPLSHVAPGDLLHRLFRKRFYDLGASLFKRGRNFVGPVVGEE